VQPADPFREGERLFTICNACRYCEGYCAVFPAMERRLTFPKDDVEYLAHLCHDCGECFEACQYAPPHEFAVDLPRALAAIREQSYGRRARPGVILAAALIALLVAVRVGAPPAEGGFYGVIPYEAMVAAFGLLGVFAVTAILWGSQSRLRPVFSRPWTGAGKDVLALTYLSGPRRWFHHAVFYGFLLCFASTVSAAFYHHVLGLRAPYAYASVPVVLGTLGGVGMLIGAAGLFFLHRRDVTFLALLFATALTGLLLLALRETAMMPPLLYLHLGAVAIFFLMMPYGKFVHGLYRAAALIRYAVERSAGK
jgi:citrate/tricarballylate utilization protein